MDKPLKDILRLFQAEPSRTWSIVMTFFGDMVLPRGGSIGLPTLLSLFHAMDVGSGTVRTALSRLSADGWVERTRIGRNAYYCLSSRGMVLSRDAEPRIYGTFSFKTQRKLRLAVASASVRSLVGDEAVLVATRMREAGYTAFAPGAWLGVDDGTLPDGIFGLDVDGSQVAMQCLAAYFSLDDLDRSYLRFEKIFSPLAKMCTDPAEQKGVFHQDGLSAVVARTLLIHEYRRIALRDPHLPEALMPSDWVGYRAQTLCATIYRALLPASEAWLTENGRGGDAGRLPAPTPAFYERFQEVREAQSGGFV